MPLPFEYIGEGTRGSAMREHAAYSVRGAGLLTVNGQFCGPVDGGGQTFPAAQDAEIFIEYTPLAQSASAAGAGAGFWRAGKSSGWNPRRAAMRSCGRTA